jgi:hypothetical protein
MQELSNDAQRVLDKNFPQDVASPANLAGEKSK